MTPQIPNRHANRANGYTPSVSGRGLSVDPNPGFVSQASRTTATAQSPKTQPSTPDVGLADLPVAVLRGVMFADSRGVIDWCEDGEPFTLRDGTILAVRDADGSIHRTPMGRSPKYASGVDAALAAIGATA